MDSSGMIWAICNNGKAVRIDPNQNPPSDPSHSPPIGRATEAVGLGTNPYPAPYNYSDMSGFVALSTTKPAGFWDFIEPSATDNTRWTAVRTVVETTPPNSEVSDEVRAANRIAELPSWPFQPVAGDGTISDGVKGRYLEVRVTLLRDFCPGGTCAGPELRSLTVESAGQGSALQIDTHPDPTTVPNQTVTFLPGDTVTFPVSVTVPPGTTATYQWRKDGVNLPNGGKFSWTDPPTLRITDVQYTEAGRYSLRVTDSTGTTLDSAEARLHVKGNAPTVVPAVNGDLQNQTRNPGQSVTFRAHATATASGTVDRGCLPISYQWRHGQTPIGVPLDCTTQDANGWLAELTLINVQCQDTGEYSVVFYNRYGAVLSGSAVLTVSGTAPFAITAEIDDVPAALPVVVQHENQEVTLTVADCMPSSCAQWYLQPSSGVKRKIPDEHGLTYSITPPITCDKLGTYSYEVADPSWNIRQATAEVKAVSPLVSIASSTLELNPSGGGTWGYRCQRSTDGVNWEDILGHPQDQNWITIAYEDTYRYRLLAEQGAITASVTGWLDTTTTFYPYFFVQNIQNGTADVRFTAAPVGVGPWTYQWSREISGQYVPIGGAETNPLEITAVDCIKNGRYLVRAADTCGASIEAIVYLWSCP